MPYYERDLAFIHDPALLAGHGVLSDTPACRPIPAARTAWMPRSCSWNDMAAAAMQYGLMLAVSELLVRFRRRPAGTNG